MQTKVKSQAEIKKMRKSGKMLESVLLHVISNTKPGVSTKDLATLAKKKLLKEGGKPAFLGLYGFPDVMCISVNDEVIHGIPKINKIVNDGDIVSIDFGVNFEGMITDAARTYVVGNTKAADKLLIQKTEEALLKGISVIKNTTSISNISHAIESTLSKANLGIVKEYVGHGVGHHLHEDPNIPNFVTGSGSPSVQPGMTIAIEPMAMLGQSEVYVADDGWTVLTSDGSRAAHFEDTVLVTNDGYEILTRSNE